MKKKKLYFAVICTLNNYSATGNRDVLRSGRSEGDWGSFIGESKDEVIKRAVAAREDWQKKCGPYKILVGEITEAVSLPQVYRLEPFEVE